MLPPQPVVNRVSQGMAPRLAGFLAALALIFLSCLSHASAAPPLVIGVATSLTGPSGTQGDAVRNASARFAELLNAAGGVDLGSEGGGKAPLVVHIVDDQGTAAGVRAGYASMLASNVSLFIGPFPPLDLVAVELLVAADQPTAIVLPASGVCSRSTARHASAAAGCTWNPAHSQPQSLPRTLRSRPRRMMDGCAKPMP